jgi:ATP-binding cassette subfamily B (MDR/TAP) protein 1
MGVYFSGQAAALAFSFASSESERCSKHAGIKLLTAPGFTKANQAANYYFWLDGLSGTICED